MLLPPRRQTKTAVYFASVFGLALLAACEPVRDEEPKVIVHAHLCRLDDLGVGSRVRYLGMPIGRVVEIVGEAGRWTVTMDVTAAGSLLRRADTLEVRSTSLLGGDMLDVIPGDSSARRVVSGTWLTGRARLATAAQRRALVRTLGAITGAGTLTWHVPPGSFAPDTVCNAERTGPAPR